MILIVHLCQYFLYEPNQQISNLNSYEFTVEIDTCLPQFALIGTNNGLKSRLDMKDNRKCIIISLPTSTWDVAIEANSGSVCYLYISFISNFKIREGWEIAFRWGHILAPPPPSLSRPDRLWDNGARVSLFVQQFMSWPDSLYVQQFMSWRDSLYVQQFMSWRYSLYVQH